MASELKNLSVFETPTPSAKDLSFGIVVAEWNSDITGALLKGAVEELTKNGCKKKDIIVKTVPGTFELTMGCQFICENTDVDAVIAIGCVIQGGTPHFEYICQGATHGINHVSMEYNTPIAFGVLTVNSLEQAQERAGGKLGNKGAEAASTAVKMAHLKNSFEE